MNRRLLVVAVIAGGCHGSSVAPPLVDAEAPEEPPVAVDAARDRAADTFVPTDAAAVAVDGPAVIPDRPGPPAGWWDPKWTLRRPVTVTNPGQEALADFVVPVVMAEAGADL